jgi:hypothetical protein
VNHCFIYFFNPVGIGNDYLAINEQLDFVSGGGQQECFPFSPLDDGDSEPPEDIELTASFAVPRADHQFSLGGNTASIDIVDDDGGKYHTSS